jgi:pyruvate, orthophosphate dikinase
MRRGSAQLLRMARLARPWLGRKTKHTLKPGACGENGGDPDSIAFFHDSDLDSVSCSPYRVFVARLVAAQAANASAAASQQQC